VHAVRFDALILGSGMSCLAIGKLLLSLGRRFPVLESQRESVDDF
jgi:hypothetical protein